MESCSKKIEFFYFVLVFLFFLYFYIFFFCCQAVDVDEADICVCMCTTQRNSPETGVYTGVEAPYRAYRIVSALDARSPAIINTQVRVRTLIF